MYDKIIAEFDETTADLLGTISSFNEEQFNKIPFEGSWTPAQVCDHLLKANSGAARTLTGNTKPAERNYTENGNAIRSIFLDFSTKMKSPDFILPSNEKQDKETMAGKFTIVMEKIKKIAQSDDLTLVCTDFELPAMGQLTRYEWICFVTCHSKRHTQQLKNIFQKLK